MTDFNIADFLSISPDSIVAYCPERIVTRRMLAQDIIHARSALYSLQASRFALYEENGYVFLVWLLAAWQNGQTVVLVPEDLSTIRQALVMPWVGGSGKAAGANALTNWQQATTHTIPSTMYFDAPGLALFTSGSSGSAHTINKSVPQLWQEAEMLEQVFGSHLPDTARFAGTVPHQHMFGLPFRLLWPFRAGRPFISKMFRYLEELLTLDICPHVLISSPATLKRITQMANITPKATIIRVFSAGSPLPCEIATHCAQQLNTQTVEIYGSTEKGAAIYRMSPHFRWQAMPDVTLAINDETQCLKLRSPLLGNDDWYQTQDVVVQKNEDWQFLGRSDRVAKIEGQRVSLDEIESALSSLEEITEARVAPTHDEREEIVAVVVLSNMGKAIMQQNSKARFDRMLHRRLKTTLVRVFPVAGVMLICCHTTPWVKFHKKILPLCSRRDCSHPELCAIEITIELKFCCLCKKRFLFLKGTSRRFPCCQASLKLTGRFVLLNAIFLRSGKLFPKMPYRAFLRCIN